MLVVVEGAGFFVAIIVVGVNGSGVCEMAEADVVASNEVAGLTSGQR